ncbi:RNA pyrophosphohydrolase [Roseobacter fucihabitans]|uniref:RNA pyrophosphohydrolase n=1 Tax=Roseobacter fucihabitans TaxID=1537242 RepID=A0ABZ2BXQ1_9RHOB|nr:RNA pyrophosphohydrolase [Roseobacter litoralis]MBC6964942.1 RNA pyrophosphohydrolase [Roseobacter litoralis]
MTPQEIAKLPYRPCVGVMLVNADKEVFVGQRRDSQIAAWQMPQGGIDEGEPARDAALRELWEETGVTSNLVEIIAESQQWLPYELPFDLVPKLWKGRYRGQKQRWFLMQFNGQDSDINIATEHPEFSEWRWLAARDLVENIVPFKRDVYVGVMAEFADYF